MTDPTQLASDQFAVGEVAIYVGPSPTGRHTYLIGSEVTVIAECKQWMTAAGFPRFGYCVTVRGFHNPRGFVADPRALRKKRPPRKDLQVVRWDQCPWQPESLNV